MARTNMLDERVEKLVDVLNRIKGVETFASCGGHPNPHDGQALEGHFFVDFYVPRNFRGFESLYYLCDAVKELYVDIVVGTTGDSVECLCFSLRGTEEPDVIAEVIKSQWSTGHA